MSKTSKVKAPKIEYVKDTFAEYLGKKDRISASDLKNFLKSPRIYFYNKNNKKDNVDERHFAIGSATHEFVMEPELFDENYAVSKKFDKRTKVGKEEFAEFQLKNEGKTIINEVEMEMVKEMSASCKMNKTFLDFMEDSIYEVSAYTQDEETGLLLRMRPDILPQTKNSIVDIKTCRESSLKSFKSDCFSYGYSLSGAFYSNFLKRENYVFVAIEKTPPYQTSLFTLNDEMMDYGRHQYRMGLDLMKWSIDNNYWCDYVEFEILKECYLLNQLDDFFDTLNKSELIQLL
jgi:hypothetical protein